MNFAFYISGKSNRLYKFLNQIETSIIPKIKVIISDYQIESELLNLLNRLGINYITIDYNKLIDDSNKRKNEILSDTMMDILEKKSIDYCFSFGSHLLKGEILNKYKYKLINFHPAILPMYPGKKSIDQAVEHGNTLLVGNTAHFIDEGIDTGTIIMQSVIPLQSFFDNNKNYDVILDIQVEMLNILIDIICTDSLVVTDNKVIIKGADYRTSHIYPNWSV